MEHNKQKDVLTMKRTAKPPFPPNDEKMSPTEPKVVVNLTLNVSQWAYT